MTIRIINGFTGYLDGLLVRGNIYLLPAHILRIHMIVFVFYFTRVYHWASINKNGPKLKEPSSMKGINSYN